MKDIQLSTLIIYTYLSILGRKLFMKLTQAVAEKKSYICYMLVKEYYYIQNFLFLIKSAKKLLSVGWFLFISKLNEKKYLTISD